MTNKTKGIILAGGTGSRLFPITIAVSKQLLPVYNKPMIYYPLSVLMLAGIREILIITTPEDLPQFKQLLGDGSQWGLSFEYVIQDQPRGLPEAFILGKDFIGDDNVCLILGDNIFFGNDLAEILRNATAREQGGVIFAHPVKDPERYGIVEYDDNGDVLTLEEKPKNPKTNNAVPGLYFFDSDVTAIAESLVPSARGETEILDIARAYMQEKKLKAEMLGRGIAWLDAGTHHSLLQASSFVEAVEERQGTMISCVEEIAYRQNFIDAKQLRKLAKDLDNNAYGQYLAHLALENH
ncbi:MAG: glucose-1-phosphate thymidylyltransferase RfbA [Lentisphaeria bacterium]